MPAPTEREIRIALNAAAGLSRAAVYQLCQEPGRWAGADGPAERLAEHLAARAGVPAAQMEKALRLLPRAGEVAAREAEAAERLGARLVLLGDPGYPPPLGEIPLPPPVLAVRGELAGGPAVAIVGSRRTDAYGQEAAECFAAGLAAAGVTVVSGFARGIDAAAHRAALSAPGGRTIAVLGCGLGVDYPAGQGRLADAIAERGAVVSELPCGLRPRAWHFPIRNRVIAALSFGTLVVQATPRSGSLITARHALDMGREVYAVPGRIFDERSLGPNALIRDGARLVQHPREILEELFPAGGAGGAGQLPLLAPAPDPEPPPGLPGEIVALLASGAGALPESLAARLERPVDQILGALLELELGGWVRRLPGGAYGR